MKRLPRPPLFTEDYIAMAEALWHDMAAYGELVLALMIYTKDGTIPENLPLTSQSLFTVYRVKIDSALKKYNETCEARAQSGAKGGKAKAANAAKEQLLPPDALPDAPFRPPGEKRFVAIVQNFVNNDDIPAVDPKEAKKLFTAFEANGWTIRDEPIKSMQECKDAIFHHFAESYGLPVEMTRFIYTTIFSESHGLRNAEGVSKAADAVGSFFDCFNADQGTWDIHGNRYSRSEWRKAFDDFMTAYEV